MFFMIAGIRKRINLYESFIEGAKEGFGVAVKIIPYLVAMLVAIGVFRASGAMDYIISGISHFLAIFGIDTSFVPALPVALMKPLSGSGARGMMVEAMKNYGPDSFVGHLASVFQGTTETTFYVVAVYYGAVGILKTRYTITCGLLADLAGVLAAIFWTNVFFG
jgi:spore maturation protein SpmB